MTDIALTEWEHQPYVLNVLTSREMGAWLGRRDSRLLQEIRQEINDEFLRCDANAWSDVAKGLLSARCIIDKKIKKLVKESEVNT